MYVTIKLDESEAKFLYKIVDGFEKKQRFFQNYGATRIAGRIREKIEKAEKEAGEHA